MNQKTSMSWRTVLSLTSLGGLLLLVSPFLYAMFGIINVARTQKPSANDEAGLLAYYGSVMPPPAFYILSGLGLLVCLSTIVFLIKKKKDDPQASGHELRLFGGLALCASAVFGSIALIGSYLILTADKEHGWLSGVHFAFAVLLSVSTLTVGKTMAFLSALVDRNNKLFTPALLVTFLAALIVGPINIFFSRH